MGDPEDMRDPARGGGGGGRRRARRAGGSGNPGGDPATGAVTTPAQEAAAIDGAAAVQPVRPNGVVGTTAPPGGAPAAPEAPFDIWLSRSLHDMFDRVKDETIPTELLRLIEEDRNRRRG